MNSIKAIFLDRDGTINVEKGYLYKIIDFEFLPGAIEGLKILQNNGFTLIIITNQSGIARGYYTEKDFQILNTWMIETLRNKGVNIGAVYYCPHHPDGKIAEYKKDCNCRKPKLGMYTKAIKDYKIDLSSSFVIGDKIRDCSICKNTDCNGYLIGNNENKAIIDEVKAGKYRNISYAASLYEASMKITKYNDFARKNPLYKEGKCLKK